MQSSVWVSDPTVALTEGLALVFIRDLRSVHGSVRDLRRAWSPGKVPDDLIRPLLDGFIGHIDDLEPPSAKHFLRLLHFFINAESA